MIAVPAPGSRSPIAGPPGVALMGHASRAGTRGYNRRCAVRHRDHPGSVHMTTDRRVLGSALAALLLVAACGGSASTAPTNGPEATAQPTEQPSETQAPAETQAPESPDVSFTPVRPASSRRCCPSEVNGVKFEKDELRRRHLPGRPPDRRGRRRRSRRSCPTTARPSGLKSRSPPRPTRRAAGTVVMAIQVEGVSDGQARGVVATSTWIRRREVHRRRQGGLRGRSWPASAPTFYVKDDMIFYVLSMGGRRPRRGDLRSSPDGARRPPTRPATMTGPAPAGPVRVRSALP